MRKIMALSMLALTAVGASHAFGDQTDTNIALAELKKQLPKLSAPKLSTTVIPGLYQIVAGDKIFYWSPNGYLVLGEIWNVKEGKSITSEQMEIVRADRDKELAPKIASLPLEKAVKVGNGKNTVIVFSDPDCPYCRRVDEFLAKRDDVTRYVFLFPLKMHKDAEAKSAFIMSQKDKAAALLDVLKGDYDNKPVPSFDKDMLTLVRENVTIGESLGITGTPVVIVNGTIVRGADLNRIKSLLESRT